MKARTNWLLGTLFLTFLTFTSTAAARTVEEAVTLDTPTGKIVGTLQLPEGATSKVPVALIIAGSGPTDRNGNITVLPGGNDGLKMLAQALADAGVASVRYDKRGIAASKAAAPANESDLRFDHYVNDASAWAERLKADPRFSALVVIGHSEGSLIGMLAAQRAHANGFVSLAGAGQSALDILRKQVAANYPPPLAAQGEHILTALEQGQTVTADMPPALAAAFRPSIQPYLISWFKYKPADLVATLNMPVLIVQGDTDIQVGVEQAQLLKAARPDATLLIVPGMNHVLKLVPADMQKQGPSYTDPSLPLAPQLVAGVTQFARAAK
jgi:uncharacterized protein